MTDVDGYRYVTVESQPDVIEVDPYRYIEVETNRVVEVDTGAYRIINVTDTVQYVPNKMVFVVGSTSGSPVSPGDKQIYGTRFENGTVHQWVITTDVPTTLSARIMRSGSYPTFSELIAIGLTDASYATGSVSIPIQNLDVMNLIVDSNDLASRISIELFIR